MARLSVFFLAEMDVFNDLTMDAFANENNQLDFCFNQFCMVSYAR